ncbi:MAG: CDP-alcohol phosphatidyltransferase family protein [Deltaproteobacteria bacterium]|nr:CDP-alcohol phosphatidyltransferase family protein [Deltaproteobacteria bacterium]
MFAEIREVYRSSRKARDNFWNTFVARPIAAVLLHFLQHLRLTPNQWTFIALAVAVAAAATLALWRTWTGLIVGAVLLEASYVLDCVDGQLARLKGRCTPAGAHLDFLMDELKAFLYVAAVTLRLWLISGKVYYLVVGLLGLAAVAAAISLTTFMRRPEYLAAGPPSPPPAPPDKYAVPQPRSPLALGVIAAEFAGQWVIHYPSYFLYLALLNFVEGYFFVYLAAHVAYLGRSLAQIVLRLGRPATAPPAAASSREPAPPPAPAPSRASAPPDEAPPP